MIKNIVIVSLLLLSFFASQGQYLDTLSNASKQQYLKYMKKRSTNQTIGWVLLGTGITLPVAYFLINSANGWNGHNKGEGMVEAGIASAILSAPFFIIAGANKRKAMLALKGERITSTLLFNQQQYPALVITLNL